MSEVTRDQIRECLDMVFDYYISGLPQWRGNDLRKTKDAICALIEKRTVTRRRLSNFAADVLGATTTSRVIGLTEILLAELGLEVKE